MGPKGPIVAAEGCSLPQELEKAARRAATFLVHVEKQRGNLFVCENLEKHHALTSIFPDLLQYMHLKIVFK